MSNHFEKDKSRPLCWAFMITGGQDELRQLATTLPAYALTDALKPGEWLLVTEVLATEDDALFRVQAELNYYQLLGVTINWERQPVPLLLLPEEVSTNFYYDPNEAMRYWMAAQDEVL